MTDRTVNIRVAGIGGMGVLTAAGITAETLFRHGYDVKKAEVHGMSQRGGSVASEVRFGACVLSPMIPRGGMDYFVLLQPDQRPLYERDLNASTVVISAADFDPSLVAHPRAVNIGLLGWLSVYLEPPRETWEDVIRAFLPERLQTVNLEAFAAGLRVGTERRHA